MKKCEMEGWVLCVKEEGGMIPSRWKVLNEENCSMKWMKTTKGLWTLLRLGALPLEVVGQDRMVVDGEKDFLIFERSLRAEKSTVSWLQ